MPIETDDGTTPGPLDPFGEQFGTALRRTADGFETDNRLLVADGHLRGRRLRRRRTAAVTAGVAVLALTGAGGVLAGSIGGAANGPQGSGVAAPAHAPVVTKVPSTTGTPTASATPAAPTVVPGKKVAEIFASLLPKGKKTGVVSRGTEHGMPLAHLVLDDGRGPGAVEIGMGSGSPNVCPKPALPGTSCTTYRTHGGKVVVFKGYEYPNRRAATDVKWWNVSFVNASGDVIEMDEWNSTQEKLAPVSRANPVVSADRMVEIVTSPLWQQVLGPMSQ